MERATYIREFQYPDDYKAIYKLWSQSGPGIQLRRSDQPAEIEKKLLRDPDMFLIAESGKKIVGSIIGGFDGRRGVIYHLVVHPSHRKLRIGSILVKEIEHRLKRKGCIRCYIFVTTDNYIAGQFYEKRGWERMDYVNVYGKDLV